MLWCDVVSEPAGFVGEGDCVFADFVVVDGGGSFGAFHYDGCGGDEDDVDVAGGIVGVDFRGDADCGLGGCFVYDCDSVGDGGRFGLCVCAVDVREECAGGEVCDEVDEPDGAVEYGGGFFVRGSGEFVEVGECGGVAFRNRFLGVQLFDVQHGGGGGGD